MGPQTCYLSYIAVKKSDYIYIYIDTEKVSIYKHDEQGYLNKIIAFLKNNNQDVSKKKKKPKNNNKKRSLGEVASYHR